MLSYNLRALAARCAYGKPGALKFELRGFILDARAVGEEVAPMRTGAVATAITA